MAAVDTVSVTAGLDTLDEQDFRRLAAFIQGNCGIQMSERKKTMVEGRLRRRVRALGHAGFDDYCRFLFEHGGLEREAVHLIDAVTTNKTDFFREPAHFEFLVRRAVPDLLTGRPRGAGPLRLWSAACSIGAEPYTIAMVLADLGERNGGLRASILATDISTRVLETALRGVYPEAMVAPVPPELRRRYLMRSRNPDVHEVRVVPELRRMVSFGRLNLMWSTYPLQRNMDVIFCRNTLIYFDKTTQEAVLRRLCGRLQPGGYLFIGHSESLAGFDLPLRQVGAAVFLRLDGV